MFPSRVIGQYITFTLWRLVNEEETKPRVLSVYQTRKPPEMVLFPLAVGVGSERVVQLLLQLESCPLKRWRAAAW